MCAGGFPTLRQFEGRLCQQRGKCGKQEADGGLADSPEMGRGVLKVIDQAPVGLGICRSLPWGDLCVPTS